MKSASSFFSASFRFVQKDAFRLEKCNAVAAVHHSRTRRSDTRVAPEYPRLTVARFEHQIEAPLAGFGIQNPALMFTWRKWFTGIERERVAAADRMQHERGFEETPQRIEVGVQNRHFDVAMVWGPAPEPYVDCPTPYNAPR